MNKIAGSILWVAAAILFHAIATGTGRSGDIEIILALGGAVFLVIGFIVMLTDDRPAPPPRENRPPTPER